MCVVHCGTVLSVFVYFCCAYPASHHIFLCACVNVLDCTFNDYCVLLFLQYFSDRFVKREISKLAVICPFSEAGCNWEGKFGEYETHINVCNYAPISCEYCTKSVRRDELESHQESCPCMPKQCPLAVIGCSSSSMSKENLQQHMQESHSEHLSRLVVHIASIEKKLSLQDSNQKSTTQGERCHLARPAWDLVEADGPTSSVRHDTGLGRSMHAKTRFVAGLQNVESSESDSMGLYTSVHAQLESVVAEEMKSFQDEVRNSFVADLRAKDEEINLLKISVTKLEKQLRSKSAELEDRDFRLSLIENSNHDGSMIWKIPQFSQRKSDAENGKYTSIFSLPFYSGRYGYKMCLRLYIMGDGIGKGTHLSLFFVVMRGEFDNILQWPFTHKITFKLINQAGGRDIVDTFQPDPLSSSFRKPKSDMNIASGCPRFVSHTELERGGFIVDDTIFIKCNIDTTTVHHP